MKAQWTTMDDVVPRNSESSIPTLLIFVLGILLFMSPDVGGQ